jgi:DNA-binding protein H-NS
LDLEKLSLKELKNLQKQVAVAIFDFEKRKKSEALAELKALAQSKGFSLDELLEDTKSRKKRAPVAPKYADPNNPDNTWSGRGRKPKWMVEALAGGASAEDFAI